ncbi:hypothetical protein ACSZNN_07810 [Aeromonas hydrophila]
MAYLVLISFLLCIAHYVYQTIILPGYRQNARDRLFALRDQLRARLIEIEDSADKTTIRAFKEVDDGLNRAINRLHLLSFSRFVQLATKQKRDADNKAKLEKFYTLISRSADDMPKHILEQTNRELEKVLAINSLMFMIYLLPVIFVFYLVNKTFCRIKDTADYMVNLCLVIRRTPISSIDDTIIV